MPFWQFYQKSADCLDWPALLVQLSISAHRKWPEMVVSVSTNQVWTKITIRSYAWSFAIQIQIQAVCAAFSFEILVRRAFIIGLFQENNKKSSRLLVGYGFLSERHIFLPEIFQNRLPFLFFSWKDAFAACGPMWFLCKKIYISTYSCTLKV